jgi:hypothetical protein
MVSALALLGMPSQAPMAGFPARNFCKTVLGRMGASGLGLR